jgi:hypothetical protein
MATTVHGTVDQSLEEASATTRRVAAAQGWAVREGNSPTELDLFKAGGFFTFGSRMTVQLEAASPSQTELNISASSSGRGQRAADQLLDGVGARKG